MCVYMSVYVYACVCINIESEINICEFGNSVYQFNVVQSITGKRSHYSWPI